jgi:hypothetical protein
VLKRLHASLGELQAEFGSVASVARRAPSAAGAKALDRRSDSVARGVDDEEHHCESYLLRALSRCHTEHCQRGDDDADVP